MTLQSFFKLFEICNISNDNVEFFIIKGTSAVHQTADEECDTCFLCSQNSPPTRKGSQVINWINCDSCKNLFDL